MIPFSRIEEITSRITRVISLIGLAGLLLLASATVLDVSLRWLFNRPIVGLNDTYSLFMALVIASTLPLCIYKHGNITIRFIGNAFGPRVRGVLDAFGAFVTTIIFSLMTWQLWVHTNQLAQDGETTWVLNWPLSPWWRVVTVLVLTCVPVSIVTVIHHIKSTLGETNTPDQLIPSQTTRKRGPE